MSLPESGHVRRARRSAGLAGRRVADRDLALAPRRLLLEGEGDARLLVLAPEIEAEASRPRGREIGERCGTCGVPPASARRRGRASCSVVRWCPTTSPP